MQAIALVFVKQTTTKEQYCSNILITVHVWTIQVEVNV